MLRLHLIILLSIWSKTNLKLCEYGFLELKVENVLGRAVQFYVGILAMGKYNDNYFLEHWQGTSYFRQNYLDGKVEHIKPKVSLNSQNSKKELSIVFGKKKNGFVQWQSSFTKLFITWQSILF